MLFSHPLTNEKETIEIDEIKYEDEICDLRSELDSLNCKIRFNYNVLTYKNL